MTYPDERARPMVRENGQCFEVSTVRIGVADHFSDVPWGEVLMGLGRVAGGRVLATAVEVVDAICDGAQVAAVFPSGQRIPEGPFVIVENRDGMDCIDFDVSPGCDVTASTSSMTEMP